MAKKIEYLNEKGNVKVSVRNQVKEQSMEMLETTLRENVDSLVVKTERKTIAIQVAEDTNGEPIYLEIEGRVNQTDPTYVPTKKSKSKETKEQPKVNLFD